MSLDARLAQLGITLPNAPKPVAAYIPARRAGNLLFISGQLPFKDGQLLAKGPVAGSGGVTLEGANAAARQCAINALAVAKDALGTLDKVAGVVRVGVWVACSADFVDQPKVANGASELLVEVFGEPGRHARAAVGTNALPLGATVEVEVCFEIKA
jgi:enamine deaminase RidA (YjgF/YER057c/UK114 family)